MYSCSVGVLVFDVDDVSRRHASPIIPATSRAADTITLADFHLWEMLDQHESWFRFEKLASILPEFPNLVRLHKEMQMDPRLQDYFQSQYYATFELNNPHARLLRAPLLNGKVAATRRGKR